MEKIYMWGGGVGENNKIGTGGPRKKKLGGVGEKNMWGGGG